MLIALLLLNLWSCKNKEVSEAENTDNSESAILDIVTLNDQQLATFELTQVALQEQLMSSSLRLNGQVDLPPQSKMSVSAALGGFVKEIKLQPGMSFRKGELIALMEDNQFIQLQQDYLTATAQLQNAQATYQRQKELNANQASSDKALLQAEADYKTLLITQKALEAKLQLIHIDPRSVSLNTIRRTAPIYAPFDGTVAQIFVNIGKYVSPAEVIFELINTKDMFLALQVFEKDVDNLKVGQQVKAFTNSNPDKAYPGVLLRLGKSIDKERVLEAYVRLDKTEDLIPGMYMNTEVTVPNHQAWGLPEECILNFEGKSYVFEVLGNNRFKLIPVQLGKQGNHWVEIANADSLHHKPIVQKGAYTLLMALKNKSEDE